MADPVEVVELPTFKIDLYGHGSRVVLSLPELVEPFKSGVVLPGVRDVKVHQPLEGPPIVTIEFVAESVKGID